MKADVINQSWEDIMIKFHLQQVELEGHGDWVISVGISPRDKTIASCGCSILEMDVKTGQQKIKLDGHTSTVYSICFSPDGNTLAFGGGDKSIHLWDVKTRQQKNKFDGHTIMKQ